MRNKGYTAINILGLAIGITCCLLIMLFVKSEWSYDKFHDRSDRLYRAWLHENYDGQTFTNTLTPIPLGRALQENISDVETTCRVYAFNALVELDNRRFNEPVNMVDANFFSLFDFPLIEGSRENVFAHANSLVLSEDLAKKYFGSAPATGKHLELQLSSDKVLFTVTGIAKKVPQESSIQFDILIPQANEKYLFSERARTSGWTNVSLETYVLLKDGISRESAEAKVPAMVKKIAGDNYKEGQYNVYLQPITDIHLNGDLPAGNSAVSDPMYSYILGTIGILILLIACINFITLSVGRSASRALEVGVRKVLGADRPQLIRQFWGEAVMMVFMAMVLSIIMAMLLIGPFNNIAQRDLQLTVNGTTILFAAGLVLFIALIAGIYPAFILSAYVPVKALKGRLDAGYNMGIFRKSLIAGQFIASIVLIIATIVVGQQLDFFRNANLGYDKENILVVSTNKSRGEGLPLARRFKEELTKDPAVISSSVALYSFSEPGWINLGYEDDKAVYRNFRMNAVDEDFISTMNLQIMAGRNFDVANDADFNNGMLVNETLVKEYGWKDPIGKKLPGSYQHQVVGVVKDFHFESLHNAIQPLAMVLQADSMFRHSNDVGFTTAPQPRINIRLGKGDLQTQIGALKAAWNRVAGAEEFEYRFLDESLNNMYMAEQRLATIVKVASVLSIFIACMGLFGLATLIVVRRTREIGIRKVLGAGTGNLVRLLSKDFVLLVIIASLLAFPLAWWSLDRWLQDFANRIDIEWWVFVVAAAIALLIALVTVSIQAIRAALANPVKSLRVE